MAPERKPLFRLTTAAQAALDVAGYRLVDDPELHGVVEALRNDATVLAVRRYREATGARLLEAKLAIDEMQSSLAD